MKAFNTLLKRELLRMTQSSVIAIVIILFLVMMGGIFFVDFFERIQALSLRSFFSQAPLLLAFFCPAIAMGSLAEERQAGTLEWLQSLPLSTIDIILAKFVSRVIILALVLLATISYPLTLASLGQLDWGPVWGGYLALLMLGSAYIAIGILASCIAKDQIIAVLAAFFFCFALSFVHRLAVDASGLLASVLQYLSANHHFANVARGVIDAKDLLYSLSIQIFALATSIFLLESKRYPVVVIEAEGQKAKTPSYALSCNRECMLPQARSLLEASKTPKPQDFQNDSASTPEASAPHSEEH